MKKPRGAPWPAFLLLGFGALMGWDMARVNARVEPTREPCVAFSYLPNIDGYEPGKIHESVVFMDAPVFDRLFAGCDNEWKAILAATPTHIVRVIKRYSK